MIWAVDSAGGITYIGPEWDHFVMADGRLPVRERILHFVHSEDRERVLATIQESQVRRLPFTCVFRILHKDGTYRRMMARGAPTLQPESGDLVGMLGTTYEMEEGDMTVTSVAGPSSASRTATACARRSTASPIISSSPEPWPSSRGRRDWLASPIRP